MTGGAFCNNCGHRNADDRFSCALCDAPLPHLVGERTAVHSPVRLEPANEWTEDADAILDRAGAPCLVVTHGSLAGSRFMLRNEVVTIGRDTRSDVFLDDITVSRHQAEIRRRGSDLLIVDTGSFNGTYLNGERINDEAALAQGDELRFGKFRLSYLEP